MNNQSVVKEISPRKKAAKALAGFMAVMALLTIGSRVLENLSIAEVTITRAGSGVIDQMLETYGTVKILNDEPVKTEFAFTALKVHVTIGDLVKEGSLLLTADIEPLKERLSQAQMDLKRRELAKQNEALAPDATTPEEMLENALRARKDVDIRIAESLENADLTLAETEEALALSNNQLEQAIIKSLAAAEKDLASAKERRTENVNAAQKALIAAQKVYEDLTNPETGIWVTKETDAYFAYIRNEIALLDAVEARNSFIDSLGDSPDYYQELQIQEMNERVLRANKELEQSLHYYKELHDRTEPGIIGQIEAALEDRTNKQKVLDKAVEEGNEEVSAASEMLKNTRQALALWKEGALVSNDDTRPADLVSALKIAEAAGKALEKVQKDREKMMTDNAATIEEADKILAKARKDVERMKKTNYISDQQKKLDNIVAEAEMEKLKNEIKQMEKFVESEGLITAPVDGTVTEIAVAEDASVAEGTTIFRIAASEKSKKIVATVSADEAIKLKNGLDADLYSDRMWAMGKVTDILKVTGTGGQTGGQTMYEVYISIEPGWGDFSAGDSVRVTIRQTSQRYYTIVPLSALREDSDGKFVLILEEQSGALGTRQIVRRVDVTVQEGNSSKVAVTGAFSDWEKLIERGDRELKDGDRVRIKQ